MMVQRGMTVRQGATVRRRNILVFSSTSTPISTPKRITINPVSPHYLGESGERHKSSDGPAKQEHVSGQKPRLEETLVVHAIEQECSLAQWKKLLAEESS